MNWIKCSDRLPKDDQQVLVFLKDIESTKAYEISLGYYDMDQTEPGWKCEIFIESDGDYFMPGGLEVTHWSPIELPEGL